MAGYYPPVGFHFRVEVALENLPTNDSRFQEVIGISREVGVEEVLEGGENRFAHRLPARAKYGNLVLKRGMLSDSKLVDWARLAIENFEFVPADVQVTLLDEKHGPLASWSFLKAYPVKWTVSDFKAQESSLVVETIELAYQFFRKVEK